MTHTLHDPDPDADRRDGDRPAGEPSIGDSGDHATTDAAPELPVARGAALRRALLQKLPRIEHDAQSLLSGIGLDRDRELLGAVELDIDAFLVPLAATRRKERR